MRGVPKHCNTKKDYEFLMDNYPEDIWRPAIQQLYDDRLQQFNRGVLSSEDLGIVDETHSIVEERGMGGEIVRYQYEIAVNSDAHMFRIGYTEEEILALLGSVI